MDQKESNPSLDNPHSNQINIQQTIDAILQYHAHGHMPQALEMLLDAIATNPEKPSDLYMLGMTAMQIGYNDQAIELIEKAIAINPNFAEAHNSLAIVYHALGRVNDAIGSFQDAIEINPEFADPHNLLGSVLIDLGRPADAVKHLLQAITLNRDYTYAHFNLGNAYMHMEQYENAKSSYENAIISNPNFADAHYNLGNACIDVGDYENAEKNYKSAIAINPNSAEAYYNLGTAQFQLGKLESAVESYQNTIKLMPEYFEAYNSQSVALKGLDRFSEAVAVLQTAVSLKPDYAEALKNLGCVYIELECFDDAIKSLNKAISLYPDFTDAYINLGIAYEEAGRYEESIASSEMALRINPELFFVHMNMGNVFKKKGEFLSAVASYKTSIAMDPGDPEGYTKLGSAQRSLGRIDDAIKSFEKALTIQPNFIKAYRDLGNLYHNLGQMDGVVKSCRKITEFTPENTQNHSTLIFSLGHIPGVSGESLLQEARHWDAVHGSKDIIVKYSNIPDPNRRIKIGYVSADFRTHAAALFLEPLLAEHNREDVEIYCYSELEDPDDVTKRFESLADHWRPTIDLDDDKMISMIIEDEIDIIVECTGRTNNNRLQAISHKPAPIQVNYFPMHGQTSGMASIDYVLSDAILSPPELMGQFSEKAINIEHGAFTFLPNKEWPEVAPPRGPDDEMVFACVGDPARISEETIDLWARLLKLVPEAKLLFKHPNYEKPYVLKNWKKRFERLGDKVSFNGVIGGWGKHMDTYGNIDVVLDTIPMTGGTSCAIPLWMGVPAITMESQYVGHRVAMCVLTNAGFPEFIAANDEEYLKIASELITDRKRLDKLRLGLRERIKASPICNSKSQARDIEGVYRKIWQTWCASQSNSQDFNK